MLSLCFLLTSICVKEEIATTTPLSRVEKLAIVIKKKESGGNYQAKGLSGEHGSYQFMPSTYKAVSKKYFNEELSFTPENQDKVAIAYLEDLTSKYEKDEDIFLTWNQGNTSPCKAGINSKGVKYDSCAYVNESMRLLRLLDSS